MSSNDFKVEPIWDHKNGRRFQIIVSNPHLEDEFALLKDSMAKSFIKLRLSEADIMKLIFELKKSISSPDFDPVIVQARQGKNHLKVVKEESENDNGN